MKFLVKDLGLDTFLTLVEEEQKALAYQTYPIDTSEFDKAIEVNNYYIPTVNIKDQKPLIYGKKLMLSGKNKMVYMLLASKYS